VSRCTSVRPYPKAHYRGEQYDSDLGLYYLRARYYNPLTGRFLSRDPNEPKLRDPNGTPIDPKKLHKYLYAGGDPINRIDPRGREDFEEEETADSIVEKARIFLAPLGEQEAIVFCTEATILWELENPGFNPADALVFYISCMAGVTGSGI